MGLTFVALTGAHDGRIGAQSECGATINPVACENQKPGDPSSQWQISGAGDSSIQGFATSFSVVPGEVQRFKIDTEANLYSIEIYRMGYYGGMGARRVATVTPSASLPQNQPNCLTASATGLIDCGNWAVSASWTVPIGTVSGIFFAKLTRPDTGGASHIFFVVRDDTGQSDVLFQTADTTWQAYNSYGGNSFYTGGPGINPGRAYKLSYNRPFNTRDFSPEDFVFNAEYPMVRWLERNGYDVSYTSGIDTDRLPAELLEHKVFLSVGHDEYWSGPQRANVEAARAAGVHLGFFSGNEVYWKTRWENSIDGSGTPYRTLVSYKETHADARIDPAGGTMWTGTWRDPRFSPPADGGRPEHSLTGTLFRVNAGATGTMLVPAANGKLRFWRNTTVATLTAGQTATLPTGTLGYEWDEAPSDASTPPGLMRLSSTTRSVPSMLLDYGSSFGSGTATHSLTLYRHPSGALVFGAGTVQWSWGLDATHDRGSTAADVRMKQATVNLLADMTVQPSTLEPGLTPATASSDAVAPTTTISSPVQGASVVAGSAVTISGTATEAGGGLVTAVEVSVDGGVTWAPATGTTSWSFAWTASGSGVRTIRSRAYDDSGNRETPSGGVSVTVTSGQVCPCTIYGTEIPSPADDGDASPVELGTKFRSDISGYVTGVRFYKAPANTGTHTGRLWTGSGVLLATVTFTGETASGWQQANFASATPIAANTTYVISYHAPNGHYTGIDAGLAVAKDKPPLHALRDGFDGPNGVYRYGTGGVFPTSTYQAEAYYVDVIFNTVPPPDTTAPTITGRFPASAATGVNPAAAVTATFSESMDPVSISAGTTGGEGGATLGSFELRDPSGTLVRATVTYDVNTRIATMTPNSALGLSTTYTAMVRGGAVDPRVKDLAGNALAANSTWTFTTAAAPPPPPLCPCSIWSPTAAPSPPDDGDPSAVEIGTKFRSDVDGFITGVRFYKSTLNTGTHTGRLWANTGVLLGSVVFTGETASGWQQANFAAPIAITANTTYVVSYNAPNGHYAGIDLGFAAGIDNGPLHGLRDGVDGPNGVYSYGNGGTFPTETYQSESYWVDVVFNTTNGPDVTPPQVTSVSPIGGLSGVRTDTNVIATFHEPMTAATITTSTVLLRDPSNNLVPAAVTFNATTRTVTLNPTNLLASLTTYTARIKGGATDPRVKDTAGNAMAADYVWSFTTAAPPPPPPTQGPGGPVLVVTSSANPFGTYLAEILRTEGLNAFATADLSTVSASTLANYDAVILGEMPLSASQVTMFTTWVSQGGNLIAMRPDKQLADLMGLIDTGTTLSNAYLLVNTASAPGTGIVGQTMQFHGTADRYTLNGATAVATLYSTAAAATVNPAVTMRAVGAGRAVAFTYDLARSVVYTRQGNPAWSGQERDGLTPIRSDDLFYGARSGDVQPDWVDLTKVAIPQADEQQRLLWNTLLHVNASKKPLPRFWYFPRMLKAVVIMTGDDHGNGGTAGRFDQYIAMSTPGCSVSDWACIRGSSYIFVGTPITTAQINTYISEGFEIGVHVNTGCADWTPTTLANFYSTQMSQFATQYPTVPPTVTHRTHCIVWSDYTTQAQVQLNNGIRFDTNYYWWPGAWVLDKPGMFTGSGMPMRFATSTGSMIDVFQAATQLTDESAISYQFHTDSLLNRALGPEGYYGAFTANMHTDHNPSEGSIGSDAIIASAQARGVPVISSKQMLDWLEGRNGSSFSSISWAGNVLTFNIAVGAGATGLRAMVPASAGGAAVNEVTLNGLARPYSLETIKGISYAVFAADSGTYRVSYGVDATAPVISAVSSSATGSTAQVQWTTNEVSGSLVSYGTDPVALNLTASSAGLVTSHVVQLTGLATNTTYYYRVSSADAAGNEAVSPTPANQPAILTTSMPSISVADVSLVEGNSGTTNFEFLATLSFASTQTITVNYATSSGTAGAAGDYGPTSGQLTFVPGQTSRTITVPVNGDTVTEIDETFNVTLSGPVNAQLADAAAAGNILNDDAVPSITISDPTVSEGNAGIVQAVFNVTLSSQSEASVSVNFATAAVTALAGTDFVTSAGTLTFTPGVVAQTVTVPVVGDLLNEADEVLFVNLDSPVGATIAKAQAVGTIANDDPLPSITVADLSIAEGQAGSANAALVLTLSAASGRTVTVAYATANGTATAGSDYTSASGTATIAAGATSVVITVPITGDTLFEPNETFVIDLSAPGNATIADPQATVTIQNDEATPALSIGNASVTEGNAGTVNASFTVALSSASSQTVTVNYATANGTATAGSDYLAASGPLTFAPGTTTQTVVVTVVGDTLHEPGEQFVVNLSDPVNAPITTAQGTGTIVNDDALPSIAIADVSLTEGDGGTVTAAFVLTLSAASGQSVTVAYTTADATATAGSDYVAVSGTATFAPGATTFPVNVTVNGDTLPESTETFVINLSVPANASIADPQATGTIVNDEPLPSLSIGNAAVTEGQSGSVTAQFTVSLAPASSQTVSVAYATANGSATAGSDYTTAAGTLTFLAGETAKTIAVTVAGDALHEADEQFVVNLSGAVAAAIATPQGTGTIANDDPVPSISVADVSLTEGNTGTKVAAFTIALSGATSSSVTVNFATANGTAISGSDYTAASGTASFAPGTTSAVVNVTIAGDVVFEGDETLALDLSSPANATLADAQATATIVNDEATPALSISDVTVTEGNAGTVNAVFTATLSPVSSQIVTVSWATANGTATAGSDYTAASGSLTFAPGTSSQAVTILVTGETTSESNETFLVNLTGPANATLLDAQGTGTITNDDSASSLVAAYGFSEGSGTTTADASGRGHTGTIAGAAWSPLGRTGNALSFDGVDDIVTVADSAALDVTRVTMMAWVNPTELSEWRTVLLKETSGDLAYGLYAHDGAPRPAGWIRLGSTDRSSEGTAALPLNTWTHLAATYDGSNFRLYVNGVLVRTRAMTGNIAVSTQALRIGGNTIWGEYFAGLIDDVRIYNRALTQAELQADMNTPIGQ